MTEHEKIAGRINADILSSEPIGQFFSYSHLKPEMQTVSRWFSDLAADIIASVPRNPERTVALRKLLEAKDAAVRASIFKDKERS